MAGRSVWARIGACAVVLVAGCASEALDAPTECDGGMPGDLVFTEIHANPDGTDGEDEYIELYNGTGQTLDLEGWVLTASRTDGSGSEEHRFADVEVAAGTYFVIGNASVDPLPTHVDYSYGKSLGNLRNSDAALLLECRQTRIDWVRYTTTRDGRAMQLDGRLDPDASANDELSNWCTASLDESEPSSSNFGSPGAANPPCGEASNPTICTDKAGVPLDAPTDAWISEWMANPSGPDAELEWVEVHFDQATNLADIQLGATVDALGAKPFGGACSPVDAGTRVVFGASPAAAPRVDADLGFSLGNSGMRSIVVAVADTVLDRVDYEGATEGLAWQRSADEELCLTDATPDTEYAADNFGTPGDANPECPPVLDNGMCFDQGVPRAIRTPRVGEVQITEWMANPAAVSNRDGEWIEVRFSAAVDLNGLVWSDLTKAGEPIRSEDCLPVAAGSLVVFARNAAFAENGGLPSVDAELAVSLNNEDEEITIWSGDDILDSIAYDSSSPGVATQIDDWGVLCDAFVGYGDGDLGTPGKSNQTCR